MLFSKARKLITESSAADMLDPEVSSEVKDVIEELEKDLTNNVEEVKEEDKTTNGGIPVTSDAAPVMESAVGYTNAKYLLKLEDVMAIKETEGDAGAEEPAEEPTPAEEPGQEPAPEEPTAGEVVASVAAANDLPEDDAKIAVVVNTDEVKFVAEMALLEAKSGRCGSANARIKKIRKTIKELKEAGIPIMRT